MPRKRRSAHQQELLEAKLSELAVLITDLSPQVRVEISSEQYEDEDAHILVYPLSPMKEEEVEHLEQTLGKRCNDILVETGLFIIGAVYD